MIEQEFRRLQARHVAGILEAGQPREDQAEIGDGPIAALPMRGSRFDMMDRVRPNAPTLGDRQQSEAAVPIGRDRQPPGALVETDQHGI